jgi:glycosyltransferase involved in cell wall biosynthesis
MKKILFFSHSGYRAGAESVLEYVLKLVSANNKSFRLYLTYPKTHGTSYGELFKHSSINVMPLYFFVSPIEFYYQILIFFLNIPAFFQIATFIIRRKIDLIYINSSLNLMPLTLACILRRKTIIHIHENSNDLFRVTPIFTRWIYRLAFKNENVHIFFVSYMSKNLWEKDLNIEFKNYQYSILYSPIKQLNVQPILNDFNNKIILGFLGSITTRKNINTLLYALDIIQSHKSNIDYSILICGNGPQKNTIIDLAKELRLSDKISFIPSTDNVELFFSKIDILVNPSINESWGLVALEAMISKKPLLMTTSCGINELFFDQQDCIYFDPNDPHDLASKIKLYESHEMRERIVNNAFAKIKEYDFNANFDKKVLELLIHKN